MQMPNPVQPIQQQIQRFSRPQVQPQPPILSGGPGQQQYAQQQPISAEAAIQQQVQELALEIYTRLAADHISDDHYTRPLSVELLRQLASHSQAAARAYFEQMGVQFSE